MLMSLNWLCLFISSHPLATEVLQIFGLGIGGLASLAFFINECMKIRWKVKEDRKNKAQKPPQKANKIK